MTKEKAYYQAFLILEHLPKEEYSLIPQNLIDEIENHMEYDENITIDTSTSLESQKIDEKTYQILDKVIKSVERNQKQATYNRTASDVKLRKDGEIKDYIRKCSTENELYEAKIEMARLNKMIQDLMSENGKIDGAKELIAGYRDVANSKDEQIQKLTVELETLRKNNEELCSMLNKVPRFVRKIFIKDDFKLLK